MTAIVHTATHGDTRVAPTGPDCETAPSSEVSAQSMNGRTRPALQFLPEPRIPNPAVYTPHPACWITTGSVTPCCAQPAAHRMPMTYNAHARRAAYVRMMVLRILFGGPTGVARAMIGRVR
jgi:hypothetical protein